MNLFDALRVILRRWYLTVPGVLLAAALAAGAWMTVSPSYTRTASLLLLPSDATLPDDGTGNPYLYMSGLSQAADVLVRSVNSQQNLDQISDEYPGAKVTVARDPSTVTPVVAISIEVTDASQAGPLLEDLQTRTSDALTALQARESIPDKNRIQMQTLTSDTKSVASDKRRMTYAGAAGAGALVLVFVVVAGVDGLLAARSRRRAPKAVRRADAATGVNVKEAKAAKRADEAKHADETSRADGGPQPRRSEGGAAA
jgi:hypothetical protein